MTRRPPFRYAADPGDLAVIAAATPSGAPFVLGRWKWKADKGERGGWEKPAVRYWKGFDPGIEAQRRGAPDAILRALKRDPWLIPGIRPADAGLAVLDVDTFPDELAAVEYGHETGALGRVKTRRGFHLLYRRPDRETTGRIRSRTWKRNGLAGEARCTHGYVYIWDSAPWRVALELLADGRAAPFPAHLFDEPEPEPPPAPAFRSPPPGGGDDRSPRTLDDWRAALEATGAALRREGNGWRFAPCPSCGGGERDRGWCRPGRSVAVTAGCNAGCSFEDLARVLFPAPTGRRFRRMARGGGARRTERTRPRPKTRPEGERPSEAISGRSGGGRPPNRPKTAGSAETEAVESPLTNERHPPRGRDTPGIRPGMQDHARRMNTARSLWARSRPVPDGERHPARLWAADRRLWPPGAPFPPAVRWTVDGEGNGSLVACFAPVADWTGAHPPEPSGVQLVHVDEDGRPRKDRGGLGKRSRGILAKTVCVTGGRLLRTPEALHAAEGLADALAVASRLPAVVLCTGGATAWPHLTEPLAALWCPVTLWPDGDTSGRLAAARLASAIAARGPAANTARIPDGTDPAEYLAPDPWRTDP